MSNKLQVSEYFYSLQGEGARAGTPTMFVRLQGCKAKNACFASGIRCDTEFESGREFTLEDIAGKCDAVGVRSITWTGGEPLGQLTEQHVNFFKARGIHQSVETSGLFPAPDGLDFICVSPKVAEHVVASNFSKVNELRYVRHAGQSIPIPSIAADHYWISPHSNGNQIDQANLRHCIELCLANPIWKLSVQQHKLWGVL